ncbi:MAG: DNA primase [Opitutae bacterium]|nr:DNA primase [Opitutae bacterium]
MPLISRKSIEEVRSRANIVELIGDYTNLTRSGSKWKGLSPFSAEKTPSFFVDPDRGEYYCFSTAQGGDAIKFLMTRENLTFPEAVEKIAHRFGIALEYENSTHGIERSMRGVLFEIHEFARGFFRARFTEKSDVAARVRDYWTRERGFSLDVAEEFSIGFLPENGSRALIDALLEKHFPERAVATSGMFGNSAHPPVLRSRRLQFETRLIIPIRDVQGRVIAFSARKIPTITPQNQWEEAKYKNSSESEIFKKGQTLFNIDKAKETYTDLARKKNGEDLREIPFVLVEGQLDAIRCYISGIKSVVAGQGTGITLAQMQLLARYSNGLDCLLDADEAGMKAALRLAPIAFEAGLSLNFLHVPDGKDPDEFLRKNSAAAEEILQNRKSAIDFITDRFFGTGERLSSTRRQEALTEVYEILSAASSLVFRSEALMVLARKAGVERLMLERDFSTFLKKKEARKSGHEGTSPRFAERADGDSHPLTTLEEDVLLLALQHEAILLNLATYVPVEWIDTGNIAGRILNKILAECAEGSWKNARESLHELLDDDDAERSFVAALSVRADPSAGTAEPDELAWDCICRFCERHCSRERAKIAAAVAALPPDSPELGDWLMRDRKLRDLLKEYKTKKFDKNKEA